MRPFRILPYGNKRGRSPVSSNNHCRAPAPHPRPIGLEDGMTQARMTAIEEDADEVALLSGADLEREARAISAHPDLPLAIRQLFLAITRQQAEHGVRRFLIGDRARRVAFWAALSLDADRRAGRGPGLTVNRFCELVTTHGEMSWGRARAIFLFMRHVGFLKRAGAAMPGKSVTYVPSGRMVSLSTARLAAGFKALDMVAPPIGAESLARLEDPAFLGAFFSLARLHIVNGIRPLDGAPILAHFIGRDGGEYIAMHLFLAHDALPPADRTGGFTFNITKVAARTHLSRAHVSAVLRNAVEAGIMDRRGDRIWLSSSFERAVLASLATTFALLANMTCRALSSTARQSLTFGSGAECDVA